MGKVKSKSSAGRAEIENLKYAKSNIFNFNSITKWCFWNFTPLSISMEHCPKSIIQIFLYVGYLYTKFTKSAIYNDFDIQLSIRIPINNQLTGHQMFQQ